MGKPQQHDWRQDQEEVPIDIQAQRRAQLITLERIYQDAHLSAHQRRQQVIAVQQRIIVLQIDRGIDPTVLTAARAEAAARRQLAAQACRNTSAARLRIDTANAQCDDHRL